MKKVIGIVMIVFLAFIVFCVIIRYIAKAISWCRKYIWLVDHGYERFIVGNEWGGAIIYAWRKGYLDVIGESCIKDMSYKEFLKMMGD